MTSRGVITLTTDFGLDDAYVGIMKGVILDINAGARVVDVSHGIPAQNIGSAAYVLMSACPYFPRDTIHVAVVDPGVGTRRKPIAIRTESAILVGPDNGIFSSVLISLGLLDPESGALLQSEAVQLTNTELHRPTASTTFHGRDIFAPVAAHLSLGVPFSSLGPRVDRIVILSTRSPQRMERAVAGEIIHIDSFGNAITNLQVRDLPASPVVEVRSVRIVGLSTNYQAGEVVAIIGSSGYLEIAVSNGNAAEVLGIRHGTAVRVTPNV